MKYRVKFKCYWYNTGAADNHHYMNFEDFDTIEEAQTYKDRINKQVKMFEDYNLKKITFSEMNNFQNSEEFIEIENGFIEDYAIIVKHFEEREEIL